MPSLLKTSLSFLVIGTFMAEWCGLVGPSSANFDLSKHSVPLDQIVAGGPGKDGIPSLLHPSFVLAPDVTFLQGDDRVLGISEGHEAKAYPVKILKWVAFHPDPRCSRLLGKSALRCGAQALAWLC